MKKKLFFVTFLVTFALNAIAKEGVALEFKLTSKSFTGTFRTLALDGNSRTEMSMTSASFPNPINVVSLRLSSTPDKAYSLNEKNKTYSEVDLAKSGESEDEEYDITVLGKEKIGNYNCVHVKVVYKKSGKTNEMWLSKDVAGYASYRNVRMKYVGSARIYTALMAKGAEGFVVRILAQSERGEQMQMDLVRAGTQSIDVSLFSLNGYTKSTGAGPGMGRPDIQSMTPEQRKEYIEEMKRQHPQH